jgi:DNA-binding response OmpR family regulator
MQTILLFTNDNEFLNLAQSSLTGPEHQLVYCRSKREAISYICNAKIDLCLFDVENDGINLFTAVKLIDAKASVAFVSQSIEDKYKVMDLGCENFMLKDMSGTDLQHWVMNVIARSRMTTVAEPLQYAITIGNSTIDFNNRSFSTLNHRIHLSRKEAELLKIFCLNKGKLLSREQILKEVWKSCDYYTRKAWMCI